MSAATNQIRAYWNGTEILNGKCSKALACQIIRGFADDFAGKSHAAVIEEAERIAVRLLNASAGASTYFHFKDDTGEIEVYVNI
jgi:hypothetical protein